MVGCSRLRFCCVYNLTRIWFFHSTESLASCFLFRGAGLTFRYRAVLGILAFLPLIAANAQTAAQEPPKAEVPSGTPAAAAQPKVSDYPDPRSLTIGINYWITGPGENTALLNGRLANDNTAVPDLGKSREAPGVEISMPVTRTGTLHLDGFQVHGTGNSNALADGTYWGTTPVKKGSYLANSYRLRGYKLYLDDLFFPHKFPVSKFRVKSMVGVQVMSINNRIDLPLASSLTFAVGSKTLILPLLGVAAEYAIAKHVLFRLEGSGFGMYKKSDMWDAAATISVRRGNVEFVGGAKALHFKTTPQKTEYLIGTLAGGFVGARWHF